MSKTYIISSDDIGTLQDLQVAFKVDQFQTVEIEQVEIHCKYTGFFETADLSRFSKLALRNVEQICADWYNRQSFSKNFENDDTPPPSAA